MIFNRFVSITIPKNPLKFKFVTHQKIYNSLEKLFGLLTLALPICIPLTTINGNEFTSFNRIPVDIDNAKIFSFPLEILAYRQEY